MPLPRSGWLALQYMLILDLMDLAHSTAHELLSDE
jgi:hypothetical protein